jgi:23S rRNA (guanosine2251-2'-O)-methyltransferase
VRAGRGRSLTVERQRLRHDDIDALVEEARAAGVEVQVVNTVEDLAESENPQGLVLDATPVPLHTVDELVVDGAAILVLDHVEDPRNVGAAARSAVAAGLTGLIVPERRAAPMGAAAFKAAAGALEHLPVAVVSSTADAVARLKERHVWTVGLAADAPDVLFGQPLLAEPVAIVIGSEVKGMGTLVRERLDLIVRIPMSPLVESLNASVTAALVAFEVARVRT